VRVAKDVGERAIGAARVLRVMRSGSHAIDLGVGPYSSSPRTTRRLFAAHFANHPRLDDLLLCLSEVVTNAVLHAVPPIHVLGNIVDAKVRVEVSDGSKAAPIQRTPTHSSPTGRGLNLLDHLASDWGVEITGSGKTVWFEIAGGPAR
jgi:anti-sigma regulatory factor (Ser/Thr protein kinase)